MLTEDYVSFETAKLLKEKGFPQEYDHYHALVYNEEDYEDEYEVQRMVVETRIVKAGTLSSYPVGVPEPKCYCPTHQMAMKWLREVHYLHITVHPGVSEYGFVWTYAIVFAKEAGKGETHFYKISQITTPIVKSKSYEQACEAAIQYCLKHLI